jgi:hypothetical protein
LTDLEQKHAELAKDVDDRLDGIKDEVLASVSEEVASKLREWKDSIKAEILAEMRSDAASPDTESGVSFDSGKSRVAAKFENLLRLSRLLENNFCMGHTKLMTPSVRAPVLLRQFFPEFEFAIARVKPDAKLVRFSIVPKNKASSADFRAKLQEVRGALLTYGWWVAQENPSDLRSMYTVTNEFLKRAKDIKSELKQFFLTLERGWIFFHEIPIVPVFLVPSDTNYWIPLADALLAKLKTVLKLDWLSRASSPPTFDRVFLRDWATIIELKQEVFDSMSPFFGSQAQPELMETAEDGINGGGNGDNHG